jgi:hypothetical protein
MIGIYSPNAYDLTAWYIIKQRENLFFNVTISVSIFALKVNVKQFLYRPGQALRSPGV